MLAGRGLLIAWIALFILLSGAVIYAELTYDGLQSRGDSSVDGLATSGAAIDPSPGGGRGAATGTALVGARPSGDGLAGRATNIRNIGEETPASGPTETAPAPPAAPAAAPAAEPPRIRPGRRVGPAPREAFALAAPPDDGKPRIAIVMNEIGLARARSRQAIERMPEGVTMAVMAYADNPSEWLNAARSAGHETLLSVPMEPIAYDRVDPGPSPLLIDLSDEENLNRYDRAISQASGFVGVLAHMGGRFLADPDRLRPVLALTETKGLIFVDNRSGPDSAVAELAGPLGVHILLNDRFVDEQPSRDAISKRLKELEAIAERRGYAVGLATPYPVSIDRIGRWAEGLAARGFHLAPVSALAARPQ